MSKYLHFDKPKASILQELKSFQEQAGKLVILGSQSALSFITSQPRVSDERYRYSPLPMVARLNYDIFNNGSEAKLWYLQ